MPDLAPKQALPRLPTLVRRSLSGQIDRAEIAAEVERQLERFESETGFLPDFVDGHQHCHVFPGIRRAVLSVLKRRFPSGGLLLRDPSDHFSQVVRRRVAAGKALGVRVLASGFRKAALGSGFSVNDGFSGYSTFGRISFTTEFDAFLRFTGSRHIIMCHPGFSDDELGAQDSIAEFRPLEYAVLSTRADVPSLTWHPQRPRDAVDQCWKRMLRQ
jgi:predicted glycoside hydrolase/deacetylase ChbG (UPF0249 family)